MPEADVDPLRWSVADLISAFREGTLSPVEVAEMSLARIEVVDDVLHAFVRVTADLAREQAAAAEAAYRSDEAGPLAGVPVSVKDAFHLAGHPTSLGSLHHIDGVAAKDSGAVRRLRAAGAVFPGKTNVSEFCQSGTTDNLLGPDTANPWDPDRTPSGSSGGAVASVAAGICPLAIGSDGGGSIRNPAAFTGLVGLKPTIGCLADEGGFEVFSPFISHGPLAWRVDDARRLYSVLLDRPVKRQDTSPQRIAWCPRPEGRPVAPGVADRSVDAIAALSGLGHRVEEIDLPLAGWSRGFGDQIIAEEHRRRGSLLADPDRLTEYVRLTLAAGPSLTDADLERAEDAQVDHRAAVDSVFESHDLIATPATAVPAFPLGERPSEIDGVAVGSLWGAFPFAVPFNVSGHPAIVVPVGMADGLPVAIQLVGAARRDALLLDVSEQLEEELALELWRHELPRERVA